MSTSKANKVPRTQKNNYMMPHNPSSDLVTHGLTEIA
jgi:hypothetical protein